MYEIVSNKAKVLAEHLQLIISLHVIYWGVRNPDKKPYRQLINTYSKVAGYKKIKTINISPIHKQ